MSDLAILVLSYDGYSDLWENFCKSFFENWPDCEYPVYLQTNTKDFSYPCVKTVKTGERQSWAWAARKAVDQIPEEYVLVLCEDYFLFDKVDNELIKKHVRFVTENGIDCLSLRGGGAIKGEFKDYREVSYKQAYCITFGFRIMRKELFRSLCKDDFSPWDFENINSFEALEKRALPGSFYTVKKDFLPIWGEGVLVKGKWTRRAYKLFKKKGYDIDLSVHGLMSVSQNMKYRLKCFISHRIPSRLKAKLKKALQGKKEKDS